MISMGKLEQGRVVPELHSHPHCSGTRGSRLVGVVAGGFVCHHAVEGLCLFMEIAAWWQLMSVDPLICPVFKVLLRDGDYS